MWHAGHKDFFDDTQSAEPLVGPPGVAPRRPAALPPPSPATQPGPRRSGLHVLLHGAGPRPGPVRGATPPPTRSMGFEDLVGRVHCGDQVLARNMQATSFSCMKMPTSYVCHRAVERTKQQTLMIFPIAPYLFRIVLIHQNEVDGVAVPEPSANARGWPGVRDGGGGVAGPPGPRVRPRPLPRGGRHAVPGRPLRPGRPAPAVLQLQRPGAAATPAEPHVLMGFALQAIVPPRDDRPSLSLSPLYFLSSHGQFLRSSREPPPLPYAISRRGEIKKW